MPNILLVNIWWTHLCSSIVFFLFSLPQFLKYATLRQKRLNEILEADLDYTNWCGCHIFSQLQASKPSELNSCYLSQHSLFNGIIIVVYHCLSFYNMLGAAEDIKKTQFLPWGLHSDRQTNKMYLRRGRLITEMQFPRCLYLRFGFVCLLTSCGLKKSLNFTSEQGHKW